MIKGPKVVIKGILELAMLFSSFDHGIRDFKHENLNEVYRMLYLVFMINIVNHIEHHLLKHTYWLFLITVLFCSYIGMQMLHVLSFSMYFELFTALSISFSPIIIFTYARERWKDEWSFQTLAILWGACFLILPIVLISMGITLMDFSFISKRGWYDNPEIKYLIPAAAVLLIIIELFIQFSHRWQGPNWLKKMSLEKTIVFLLIPISMIILFSSNIFKAEIASLNTFKAILLYLFYVPQVFFILFIYYCFYYIHHHFLFARLLDKKGIIYYVVSFVGTLLILAPLVTQLFAYLPVVQDLNFHPVAVTNVLNDINIGIPMMGMLFTLPFIVAIQWSKKSTTIATLEKEKSSKELSLLKQQINPHFFFNTLNNLYALSIKKDKQTPEVIMQLSELMRYVIYKGKEDTVKLSDEVKYVEDYIQLQQIRLHKKLDFRFDKDIKDATLQVPPLLLIILVENAFKHGIEPAEQDCYLHLRLESDEHTLRFSCGNSFEEQEVVEGGIGLNNLKRRLAIRFPEQHELIIQKNQSVYQAQLNIHLL